VEAKIAEIGPMGGGDGPHHAAQNAFPVDFFFSWSFISRKNDVVKRLGAFNIRKVSKSEKHAKTRKSASQC
jgi:hypothetical protein